LPIYPAGAARIEELVSKLAPVETQLFLALRNPASFITSTYSQALFAKVYVGPRTFRANNNWRLVDWAEYVARLRSIPGVSKIFVWRHEDYEAAQRLVLRRLLRWSVGRKIKQSSGRVHQGMSVEAVRQTLELAQSGQTGALASDARKAFPVSDTHKRFQLYAPSTLMEATQIYEEQIARIGQIDGVTLLRMRKAVHKA